VNSSHKDSVDLFCGTASTSEHPSVSVEARSPVAHVVTCFVSTGLRQLDPVGIPAHLLQQLQSVMNAAARLISPSSKFDYVTPVLRQLHWLKVGEQIDFELAVLVYKCLHGLAPPYLIHELCRPADLLRLDSDCAQPRLHH